MMTIYMRWWKYFTYPFTIFNIYSFILIINIVIINIPYLNFVYLFSLRIWDWFQTLLVFLRLSWFIYSFRFLSEHSFFCWCSYAVDWRILTSKYQLIVLFCKFYFIFINFFILLVFFCATHGNGACLISHF